MATNVPLVRAAAAAAAPANADGKYVRFIAFDA